MPVYVGDSLMAHASAGCYRCHRGDSLVDMDVQIVGEGALAICKFCILEAAEVAGLSLNEAAVAEMRVAFEEERKQFSPEAVAALQERIDVLEAEVVLERAVVDRLMGKPVEDPTAKSSLEAEYIEVTAP